MAKAKQSTKAPANTTQGVIESGVVPITIRGGERDGQVVNLDLMLAKMAIERVEAKHQTGQPGWTTTPEFLADIANGLVVAGVPGCSGAMAYQIWHIVTQKYADLKKNMP